MTDEQDGCPECVGCTVIRAIDEAVKGYVARTRPGTEQLTPEEFRVLMNATAAMLGKWLGHIAANVGAPVAVEQFELLSLVTLRHAGFSGDLKMRRVSEPGEAAEPPLEVGTKH